MSLEHLNVTEVPSEYIDQYMGKLSGAANKVFVALCRKILGYNKKYDAVSYSQIGELTGLTHTTISNALRALLAAQLIRAHREEWATTVYSIKFKGDGPGLDMTDVTAKKQIAPDVYVTDGEYERLCKDYRQEDVDRIIAELSNALGNTIPREKYKSHYKTIRNWLLRQNIKKRKPILILCPCGGAKVEGTKCERCGK